MSNSSDTEKKNYWLAGGDAPIPHLTAAALAFAFEHSRLLDFNIFFSDAELDKLRTKLHDEPAFEELSSSIDEHKALLYEVIVCRVVDNFLCFISDLLALIYKATPEMLKSSEQERLDFVLQYDSMDELRSALAEKRVERLAYLGLKDLAEHLATQMGFDLFANKEDLERAALIIEYRNLLVHNRGVVSSISVRRFKQLKPFLSKRLEISSKYVTESRKFLENYVIDIDVRASQKFGLPVINVPEPPSHLVE